MSSILVVSIEISKWLYQVRNTWWGNEWPLMRWSCHGDRLSTSPRSNMKSEIIQIYIIEFEQIELWNTINILTKHSCIFIWHNDVTDDITKWHHYWHHWCVRSMIYKEITWFIIFILVSEARTYRPFRFKRDYKRNQVWWQTDWEELYKNKSPVYDEDTQIYSKTTAAVTGYMNYHDNL